MLYKILYVKIAEAMDRPGPLFDDQLEAEEYAKNANKECVGFHCWAEPFPEPEEAETKASNPSPHRRRMNAQGKLTATQKETARLKAKAAKGNAA